MPNLDGNEVINLVNKDNLLKSRVKIVVITANLLSAHFKEGISGKVFECFEKPVQSEMLLETIEKGILGFNYETTNKL